VKVHALENGIGDVAAIAERAVVDVGIDEVPPVQVGLISHLDASV